MQGHNIISANTRLRYLNGHIGVSHQENTGQIFLNLGVSPPDKLPACEPT